MLEILIRSTSGSKTKQYLFICLLFLFIYFFADLFSGKVGVVMDETYEIPYI